MNMKLLNKIPLTRFITSLLVLGALFIGTVVTAHDVPNNMVTNGTLETSNADNSGPANFIYNQWGNLNAQGSYETAPDGEGKAAHVKVSNYVDGDAKWYFDPINVNGNTKYIFTDRYKSTASSEVVIQYNLANNDVPQYEWLGALPASSTWSDANYSFTTPTDAVKLSVFHVMAQNGELWTDDFAITTPVVIPPVDGNMIPNGSAELAGSSATVPAAWRTNAWGDLKASFNWDATQAKDGTKSLHTKVTNYASGDAKWYFEPLTAKPSTAYDFSDAYKATTGSEVVVQFISTSGVDSYYWLGANDASANWQANNYTFTTPADVATVSVFHVLASNGELWVDDYKMSEKPASPVNIIANPSVETPSSTNAAVPSGWTSGSWGNSTAQFEYLNTGHTGGHSVKTTVSNYVDGDAKWYFTPVHLVAGNDYRFSDYYQSNTSSRVVMEVTMGDGSVVYYELPIANPSTKWKQYSATFTMPTGGVSATVYHMLSANGYLVTDDYSFDAYKPTGFNRGLVTLTFDDKGWEDNIDTAFPVMDRYGYLSDQFYVSSFIQDSANPAAAIATIRSLAAKGHEIESHTVTHPDLTSLTSTQLTRELRSSQNYLQQILGGKAVNYLASPYGLYNQTVLNHISKYYTVHRTVDAGYNSKDNFDQMRLKVQNVLNTTTPAEVQQWVDKAYAEHTWLILVYHRVANDAEQFDTTPALFEQQMQVIHDKGIPVVTITQALGELKPQL